MPIDSLPVDPVRENLEELKANPKRFQKTGGYERLLRLLQEGCSPAAVNDLLKGEATFIGDVLWTVCELDDVSPYVAEAVHHMEASDVGTAAYAIEILLRGGDNRPELQAVFRTLESAPIAVCEHAIRVLAAQGLLRARDIFRLGDWGWAGSLFDRLARSSHAAEQILQSLVGDSRQEHQLAGLVVATIASEHDDRAVQILEQSRSAWARDFAGQLRQIFGHRWHARGDA